MRMKAAYKKEESHDESGNKGENARDSDLPSPIESVHAKKLLSSIRT